MSVQELARSLAATGFGKLPGEEEEGIYPLKANDGGLVEKLWVGDFAKNETMIASDAREDTAASYLLDIKQDVVSLALFRAKFLSQSS